MPIPLAGRASTLVVRRAAFESASLSRQAIDRALVLTADEFRVELDLIAIGPIHDTDGLGALIRAFEDAGLQYFDDFFEMSGNWPDWLSLHAMARGR